MRISHGLENNIKIEKPKLLSPNREVFFFYNNELSTCITLLYRYPASIEWSSMSA